MSQPRHQRGTPIQASPEDAERIMGELAETSKVYGTSVKWDGSKGTVSLS